MMITIHLTFMGHGDAGSRSAIHSPIPISRENMTDIGLSLSRQKCCMLGIRSSLRLMLSVY